MSRYFVDQPSLKNVLGDRRELKMATKVGVEYGPNNAVIFLQVTDRGLHLYGDDAFRIAPMSSNVVDIYPNESHLCDSRIEDVQTDRGDRQAALKGIDLLFSLANHLTDAKTTKTAAARAEVADRIRRYARAIKRVI